MKRGETPVVHVGRDGWLFLIGGTNRVLSQYRSGPRSAWRLWRWRRLIGRRLARARALGIDFFQIVVPEKLSVYDDRLDGLAVDPSLSPARRLGQRLAASAAAPCAIDLVGPLRAARVCGDVFRRTDTHWTFEGCFLAYMTVVRACGAKAAADLADSPFVDQRWLLDLGDKCDPPLTEIIRSHVIARDSRRVHANDLVLAAEAEGAAHRLHVGAHVVYRNDNPACDQRTLVLFGDSCAHFAPIMLTGMLAETFREVHFIWSANIDWAYVERVRPDLLICEIAERFLARVPTDRFDVVAHAARRRAERPHGAPTTRAGG